MKFILVLVLLFLIGNQNVFCVDINLNQENTNNDIIEEQLDLTCTLALTNTATHIISVYPKIIDGTFTFPEYITFVDKLVKDVTKVGEKCDGDWEEILKIIIDIIPKDQQLCVESVIQVFNQAHILIQSLANGDSILKLFPEVKQLLSDTQNTVNTCTNQELLVSLPDHYEQVNNCMVAVNQTYPEFMKIYENNKGQQLFGMNTFMQAFPHISILKTQCYDYVLDQINNLQ